MAGNEQPEDGKMVMGVKKADKPFEWNLNTLIQIATFVSMVIGLVVIWVDKSRDIEELQGWRSTHETLHKERLAEVKGVEARHEERFRNVEGELRKLTSVSENLTYRVTTNENSTNNLSVTVRDIQTSLSQLAGDMRVMKEILQRIDAKSAPPRN